MTNSDQKRPRKARWLVIGLIVSAGFNLLIIGAAIGMAFHWRSIGPPLLGSYYGMPGLTVIAHTLDKKERAAIGEKLSMKGLNLRQRRNDLDRQMQEMVEVLNDADFDRDKIDAVFLRHREAVNRQLQLGHEMLTDHFSAMSPQQRRELAAGIAERGRRKYR